MSWLFTSGGQNMDASVLLMNIEGWFPLGLIALISSLSKRLLNSVQFSSVTQSCLTLCDPMDMEHARPPCPSPTPGVYSESCPLSRWCHPAISSSDVLFSFCLQSFPASGSSNQSALQIRWPKYWSFSFSISPSNEYSGLISFRIDWFDFLAVQGTLKSLFPAPQFESTNSLVLLPSLWSNSHIHTWPQEKP